MMELQVRHMSEPAVHSAEHILNQKIVDLSHDFNDGIWRLRWKIIRDED